MTGSGEAVKHPAHGLLFDHGRGGQFSLGTRPVPKDVQRDQAGVGQALAGEPAVPVLLDQACRHGQQPSQ